MYSRQEEEDEEEEAWKILKDLLWNRDTFYSVAVIYTLKERERKRKVIQRDQKYLPWSLLMSQSE